MWGKLWGSAENSPGSKSVCVEVMMGLKFLILGKRMVFSLETWPKTHQFSYSMMWKSDSADVVWPPQKRQTINFNFNFCTIYILTGNSIVPVVCDFFVSMLCLLLYRQLPIVYLYLPQRQRARCKQMNDEQKPQRASRWWNHAREKVKAAAKKKYGNLAESQKRSIAKAARSFLVSISLSFGE